MSASLSVVARRFSFVREVGGANRGAWVQMFIRFCDGVAGDSWCADFESFVENVAYYGKAPSPRSGSTITKLAYCRKQGWVVTTPAVDDLFFYVRADGTPHHIGIVTGIAPLTGIAGNTSQDGASSNGDGVYEKEIRTPRKNLVFVRLP